LPQVVSIVITIIGALAFLRLPISEYPEVVPPTVVVRTTYPARTPVVIADTVASPLEQSITRPWKTNLYMFSQATADGVMTLTITFRIGTDLDKAQVQVQNRVAQTLPRFAAGSAAAGVTTEKTFARFADGGAPDFRRTSAYNMLYLANYAVLQVKDELSRLQGVGNVQIFGAGDFSMRVWLDPNKLASHSLTATDVVRAIREQNVQSGGGSAWCAAGGQRGERISVVGEYAGAASDGRGVRKHYRAGRRRQITRVRDVGRVELGASTYALRSC